MEAKTLKGPMVGGVDVDLGVVPDTTGTVYRVLLQYGGELHSSCTSSSLVNGVWVKSDPLPPCRHPIVTLTPVGGGAQCAYNASYFVENARCGLGFIMARLWHDEADKHFEATDVRHLAEAIETAIPDEIGRFNVAWFAPEDDPDSMPF